MTFLNLPPLTLGLAGLTTTLVLLRWFAKRYPDIHPFALYNQTSISPVRKPDESAVHRANMTPFTYPLISGLNIREGHTFRDGDLRDVWGLAERGDLTVVDSVSGEKTVLGYAALTPKVDAIAAALLKFAKAASSSPVKVAVYLPNSLANFLISSACANHGFAVVLVPLTKDMRELSAHLAATLPDVLVCNAGTIDFLSLELPASITSVVLVPQNFDLSDAVKGGVDAETKDVAEWTEQLETKLAGRGVGVHTLSEMIGYKAEEKVDVLDGDAFARLPAFVATYTTPDGKMQAVEFAHHNIVSAVAAQLRSLPQHEQLRTTDVVAPLDSWHELYNRIMLLTGMAAGAHIVLCGTSGGGAHDLEVVKSIQPTVLIASANTLLKMCEFAPSFHTGFKLRRALGLLAQGSLPSAVIPEYASLRILYTHEDQPPLLTSAFPRASSTPATLPKETSLTSTQLTQIRALLGARVIYALTHAQVAGAICQTHLLDYRDLGKVRNFGSVMPSLEAMVRDVETLKGADRRGQLFVRGPAAIGRDWVATDIVGEWGEDGCFREL
ncbi:hypothetical protein BZA70DRAFT_285628 [Myxozyma melibiosi]|uniref:AMP-dependent synthetase/ligase domain-containing protein n=1 Tax=Myxozyma melibiosi TaxID=54550 RepID=A0ABR1EYG0_9ASCO